MALVRKEYKWACYLTLKANFVSLQGSNGLPVEILRVHVSGHYTSNVDLVPLDWNILMLENGFNGVRDFGTNTIS